MLNREAVINAIQHAVQPLTYVHAMWQGGAAAFGRVDEWSDIDVQFLVDDDHVQDTAAHVEAALLQLTSFELRFELPQPTWHGHWQAFYRLKDASPFLLIDLAVIKLSSQNRFLEPEIHGKAKVNFDKLGVVHASKPLDQTTFIAQIKGRMDVLRLMFDLFQVLTLKEIHRKNAIEAASFYQAYTLRPLVEVLRVKYDPARYNFHTRYVHYDFPPEAIQRLEPLFYPSSLNDLALKFVEAQQFFWETIETIDFEDVAQKLRPTS